MQLADLLWVDTGRMRCLGTSRCLSGGSQSCVGILLHTIMGTVGAVSSLNQPEVQPACLLCRTWSTAAAGKDTPDDVRQPEGPQTGPEFFLLVGTIPCNDKDFFFSTS